MKWKRPRKPEKSKLLELPRKRLRKLQLLPKALKNKRLPKLNKLELKLL